ncbi:outer membrane beta-barrel protein [Reichenbachiella agarivorans]|uniref:Outer membrane beta-barrel protein n=1 Tax=Reichenbachiella agarivorans TaxID=2979464 RepID=A0ABY6CN28_9BACT|nr:OmpW family outer membrane protein [Reichenbachiella agarivorans]UXP31923.1 outer membrane beta-barrel protein [Reichenbachiella agarivorans]
MKKLLLILTICVATLSLAHSQDRQISIAYSVAIPLGDVGDYIQNVSPRGVYLNYSHFFYEKISVGLSAGITTFYEEKASDTYSSGNITATGKQFRYSNHIPLMATAAYYLQPESKFNPYAQIGIGTMYTRRDTDMGIKSVEEEAWGFALAPEIGIQYELSMSKSLLFSIKYCNGFKAGNELDQSQSFLTFNFGITL